MFVAANVEHHPSTLENAGVAIFRLNLGWRRPIGGFHFGMPGFQLGGRRGVFGPVINQRLPGDNSHRIIKFPKWDCKLKFPIREKQLDSNTVSLVSVVPLPADRFLWTSFSSYSAANYSDPADRMQSLSRACLAVRQQFGPKTVNNFVFLA